MHVNICGLIGLFYFIKTYSSHTMPQCGSPKSNPGITRDKPMQLKFWHTIVRPLIRLAQSLPAGEFLSGLLSCQSKKTSSPQACCACEALQLPCRVIWRRETLVDGPALRWNRLLAFAKHACNVSVESERICWRQIRPCAFACQERRNWSLVHGRVSFFFFKFPPMSHVINRRHVESHKD